MYGTLKSKSCPRCGGNILIDRDLDGWDEVCLQCGYRLDLIGIIKVWPQVKAEEGGSRECLGRKGSDDEEAQQAMHKAVRLVIGT